MKMNNNQLRNLRNNMNMSRRQFANVMEVSPRYVCYLENGQRKITEFRLRQLAIAWAAHKLQQSNKGNISRLVKRMVTDLA